MCLNLPSVDQVGAVNRLARTTGSNPVPEGKVKRGYQFKPDKFGISGLTPISSETVDAPRVLECPVQLEAVLEATHYLAENDPKQNGNIVCFEVRVQRVHLEEFNPDGWRTQSR